MFPRVKEISPYFEKCRYLNNTVFSEYTITKHAKIFLENCLKLKEKSKDRKVMIFFMTPFLCVISVYWVIRNFAVNVTNRVKH